MGDRGNIVVKQPGGASAVYLYSHWGGSNLPKTLQDALKRGESRWGDHPYLTRIIFCEMAKDNIEGTTGLGISTSLCDNEHHFLVVDTEAQEVALIHSEYNAPHEVEGRQQTHLSFKEFCAFEFGPRKEPWDQLPQPVAMDSHVRQE